VGKVVTHLATFRGEARFSTWVYSIARHHLLNAVTRGREAPEVSLESMAERLEEGLAFAERHRHEQGERALTPEDKVAARQTALACTQSMLMTLGREHRLAYVLDVVLGLDSNEAAEVCGITPAAHRQRLARARARLDGFVSHTCGLANPDAACRCERQLPALRQAGAAAHDASARRPTAVIAITPAEHRQAQRQLDALQRLGDAAAVLRAHPEYSAPSAQLAALRAVLKSEGMLGDEPPRSH
jgi:RNA polymerase sigma factor (sigma-70 family)